MATTNKRKITSFDGLRFLFSILIFLNHCTFLNLGGGTLFEDYLHNGGFSVSFFFLMSGYGLAIGYAEKFGTVRKENYKQFVFRRLKKIYPAYLVSMFIILFYELVMRISSGESGVLKEIVSFGFKLIVASTMTQAWVYTKYWSIGNSVGWYISCLFFMYLITPFLFHFMAKIRPKIWNVKKAIAVYGLIMLACYSFIVILDWVFRTQGWESNILYLTPLVRVPHFIIGVCGGYIYCALSEFGLYPTQFHSKSRKYMLNTFLELGCIFLTVVAYLSVMKLGFQFDRRTDVMSIPVLMLLLLLFSFTSGAFSSFFGNSIQRYLGGLSMYIYLFHYILIIMLGEGVLLKVFGTSDSELMIVCVLLFVITFVVSVLFQKVEKQISEKVKIGGNHYENSSINSD